VQPRPGKQLCEPTLAHGGDQSGEIVYEAGYQVGESVHGPGEPDKGLLAVFVEPLEPAGDSGGSQEQPASELCIAPSAGCLALEARTQEVEFPAQQSDLGLETVVFAGESDASDATVDSPASSESDRRVSQADGMQDAGADMLGPATRQRYGFRTRVIHRLRQPEPQAGDKARSSPRGKPVL